MALNDSSSAPMSFNEVQVSLEDINGDNNDNARVSTSADTNPEILEIGTTDESNPLDPLFHPSSSLRGATFELLVQTARIHLYPQLSFG